MSAVTGFLSELFGNFVNLIRSIQLVDVVDILLVAVLFYYIYVFIRERRAGKLALGVVLLLLLQILSSILNMTTLKYILQNVFQVGLIALIVVFQPELRSVLELVGSEPLRGLKSIGEQKEQMTQAVANLTMAVCDLAKDKTGALIVCERSTRLGDIIRTGTVVNADLSPFLVKNIFFNKAPLHDGAVVVRDGRICAAGCFLPLTGNHDLDPELGTRHRAAIGMSESSDAVIVVVSEETGTISVAIGGELKRNYNYTTLKNELTELLLPSVQKRSGLNLKKKNGADKKNDSGKKN